ncbi:MAG: TetR/AcrR family transcriptional regulator [Eubacteriaceae bacterium]|nr:TetR/AcrR family transcriptional regulator [Eubacteriaceae bacterium]
MQAADNRQRIYSAASALFYEKGYNNTTVSEIIEMSKTNKGSFYHHFEDKLHLAYNIYSSMVSGIETAIKGLFPELDDFGRLFLQECIFWRVFFTQAQIRHFASEVCEVSYTGTKMEFLNAILDHAPENMDSRGLIMISGIEYALKSRLVSYVGRFAVRLREEEFVRFYLGVWLGTYGIQSETIQSCIDDAYKSMSELTISSNGFDITVSKTA